MNTFILPEKVYFFEVEPQDHPIIQAAFPQARIFSESLLEANVHEFFQAELVCTFIYSDLNASVMSQLPNLKCIVTRSVGYNHIDLAEAQRREIAVCHVPDYGSHVIAEHTFALLLASAKNIIKAEKRIENNCFQWQGLRGLSLRGKTLGVIGTGRIGIHVCRIASLGFQMNVLAFDTRKDNDKSRDYNFHYVDSLDQLWPQVDFLTLHTPLFNETHHLINDTSIEKMKPGIILVNTARGELIDTQALLKAVHSGKISEAALDVVEHENNIRNHNEILHTDNILVTPHIAFYADDSMRRMYEDSFDSIKRAVEGHELIHRVLGH